MGWKNFFYFSSGERRALTLLLFIIATALVLLIIKDYYIPPEPEIATTEAPATSDTFPKTNEEEKEVKPVNASPKTPAAKEKYSPKPRFNKSAPTFSQKYPKGTIVELNSADTTVLKKVPGIGTGFSNRIVKYRELLGGYASVEQLREVYGIDEERFEAFRPWFSADTAGIRKLSVNALTLQALARHPYLSYKQARVIINLRERKGSLSGWQSLGLLEEFTEEDIDKLKPYISFE